MSKQCTYMFIHQNVCAYIYTMYIHVHKYSELYVHVYTFHKNYAHV
jgi:hypothetical protein